MSKCCFDCKHSYNKEYCSLFDELIEENCSCFMFNSGDDE